MQLKRLINGSLNRIRTVFRRRRKTKRNYFRKPGQSCIPETLMECIGETAVASIGDSYRRIHPEWTVKSGMAFGAGAPPSTPSFRKRRQLLMDTIEADFTRGNLIQVQGWVLAQTEAEQCARLSTEPLG